jgi:hypothetical protein
MGRPRASNAVRDFAALFAHTVTAQSTSRYDWVARTGMHSIYVLLSQLAPKVCKIEMYLYMIFKYIYIYMISCKTSKLRKKSITGDSFEIL